MKEPQSQQQQGNDRLNLAALYAAVIDYFCFGEAPEQMREGAELTATTARRRNTPGVDEDNGALCSHHARCRQRRHPRHADRTQRSGGGTRPDYLGGRPPQRLGGCA